MTVRSPLSSLFACQVNRPAIPVLLVLALACSARSEQKPPQGQVVSSHSSALFGGGISHTARVQVPSNPFNRPLNTTDYYGSGDVNLDGRVDTQDATALRAMIGDANRQSYRADVNGDLAITEADATMIDDLVANRRTALPAWWERLSRAEKATWMTTVLAVYGRYYGQQYETGWYVCADYDSQWTNLGMGSQGYGPGSSNFANAGQTVFNLPIYSVGVGTVANTDHAIDAVLIGSDPLNWSDWFKFDQESPMNHAAYPLAVLGYAGSIRWTGVNGDSTPPGTCYDPEFCRNPGPPAFAVSPDLHTDTWNPVFLPQSNGLVLVEKDRDDLSRWLDIHVTNVDGLRSPSELVGTRALVGANSPAGTLDAQPASSPGTYHLLWRAKAARGGNDNAKAPAVYYGLLDTATNTLSQVVSLTDPAHPVWASKAKIFTAPGGILHVLYQDVKGAPGVYWTRFQTGVWSTPQLVAAAEATITFQAAADGNGLITLAVNDSILQYQSAWGTPVAVPSAQSAYIVGVAAPSNGVAQILSIDSVGASGSALNLYSRKFTGGTWEEAKLVDAYEESRHWVNGYPQFKSPDYAGPVTVKTTPDGSLHALWARRYWRVDSSSSENRRHQDLRYARFVSGAWTQPVTLAYGHTNFIKRADLDVGAGGVPVVAWETAGDDRETASTHRLLLVPEVYADVASAVAARLPGDIIVMGGTAPALTVSDAQSLAQQNGAVVFAQAPDLTSISTSLTNVVVLRSAPVYRETQGPVRALFRTIEDAVDNANDAETIEVYPGTYVIARPAEINPRAIFEPANSQPHRNNPRYQKGVGIQNVKMVFKPGANVSFAPQVLRGIYLNSTGSITGTDNVTLTPSILLVRTFKGEDLKKPVTGFFASLGGAADASEPGEKVGEVNEGNTILLGPLGSGQAYDGSSFLLVDESIVGVQGSTRSESTVIRIGDATTPPVTFTNDLGILISNVQFEVNIPGLSDESGVFSFSSCDTTPGVEANSEFKNVVFVNTTPSLPRKGRGLQVRYDDGTFKLTNALFKNFYVGVDVVACSGSLPAPQPVIDGVIFDDNHIGGRSLALATGFQGLKNSNFWHNDADLVTADGSFSGAAAVDPVSAGGNLFVAPGFVDEQMLDFRLTPHTSPGSPLIDAHPDGFTDIGPFQLDTRFTASAYVDTTIRLPDGAAIEVQGGILQPHTLGDAVAFTARTDIDLRPVYEVVVKKDLTGTTTLVSARPSGSGVVPSLPSSFTVLDARLNGVVYGSRSVGDLASGQGSIMIPDRSPPAPVANATATVVGGDLDLTWVPPSEPDVRGIKIFAGDSLPVNPLTATQVVTLPKTESHYRVVGGASRGYYAVCPYDHTGNHGTVVALSSRSQPFNVTVKDEGASESNISKPRFLVSNPTGGRAITQPTARVWFSRAELPGRAVAVDLYYANRPTTTALRVHPLNANHVYAEVSLAANANLNPGDDWDVSLGVHFDGYYPGQWQKTNDWSLSSVGAASVRTERITIYDSDGVLVYGIEPNVFDSPVPTGWTAQVFGFEDPAHWTLLTSGERRSTAVHSEGQAAIEILGGGYQRLHSMFVSSRDFVAGAGNVSFDLRVGPTQPNPWWIGQVMLVVSCPSAGILDRYLGQHDLASWPRETFGAVSFAIPADVLSALSTPRDDWSFDVVLNTNAGSGPYIVDGLRLYP